MSVTYLILCQRPATRALKRHPLAQVKRRKLVAHDPLPDPSWQMRVKEVVEVSAPVLTVLDLGTRTDGAVYDVRAQDFLLLEDGDATARAQHLLFAGDAEALARWIRCGAPDPHEHGDPRWSMLDAIRAVVEPALPRLDARRAFVIANALRAVCTDATELDELCLALAARLPGDAEARAVASRIREQRQVAADAIARPPQNVAEVQALFAGVAAHDASAQRRLQKFLRHDHGALASAVLDAIDAGYDPPTEALAGVIEAVPMARLSASERDRLRATTQETVLARAMRDAAAAYAEAAGLRAAAFAQARFDAYEKYRLDPARRDAAQPGR